MSVLLDPYVSYGFHGAGDVTSSVYHVYGTHCYKSHLILCLYDTNNSYAINKQLICVPVTLMIYFLLGLVSQWVLVMGLVRSGFLLPIIFTYSLNIL